MKILFLFIDMYRADSLKIYNPLVKSSSEIEKIFTDLGGCVELERYTEGPDTPRSMASFYTGSPPWKNGCNERSKWPKFFLEANNNILSDFQELGFEIYTCISKYRLDVGLLPPLTKEVTNFENLNEFFESKERILSVEDGIYFFDLDDYHSVVDDYSGDPSSHSIGDKKVCNSLNRVLRELDSEAFDLIYIFSDHGCCLSTDDDSNYEFTGPKRTKVLSFVHRKGDEGVFTSDVRCTLSDFRSSIKHLDDRIVYEQQQSKTDIVIEDYRSILFSNNKPNIWKVLSDQYSFVATTNERRLYKNNVRTIDPVLESKLEKALIDSSCSYNSQKKLSLIESYYSNLKSERLFYNDMTRRLNMFDRFKYKISRKIRLNFFGLKRFIINKIDRWVG